MLKKEIPFSIFVRWWTDTCLVFLLSDYRADIFYKEIGSPGASRQDHQITADITCKKFVNQLGWAS